MAIPRVVRSPALAASVLFAAGAASAVRAQAPDSARIDSTPVTLVGKVIDSSGAGLPGAEITMLKNNRVHAITGDSGEFRIAGLIPGTVVFSVRRIGFEAATFTAVLRPGKVQRAKFSLSPNAQALPTVSVSDTATKTHWLDQFERRKSGARGTFITRADIVKHNARTGVDIVRTVPGVRIASSRGGMVNTVIMTRGNGARPCYPTMFIHNMPYSGTLDDFSAEDIEAMEVYVGISEIPPELDKNGRGICAAIVVWTRDPRKVP